MSGLTFQVVPVSFGGHGQDTRTNPKLVVADKWLSLVNYSLSDDNAPQRRDGTAQLVGGTVANGLALHGQELLVASSQRVSSYSPGKATLVAKSGELGFVGVAKTEVQRATNMQNSPDCASGADVFAPFGTFTCYVWRDLTQFGVSTGINCTLVDEATGTKLLDNFVIKADAGAFCPRVVYSLGAFFIFYISGTHLYCRVIDPHVSTTPGAEVALITDANLADINFDACAFGSAVASSVFVVYGWANGVTSVKGILVTRAGTVPTIASGLDLVANATIAIANVQGLCCASFTTTFTGNAGCFVLHTGGVSGVVVTAAFAVSTAVTLLDPFAPVAGASHICACLTTAGASGLQVFSDQQAAYGTAAISPLRTGMWGATLVAVFPAFTLINSASFGGGAAPAARGPQGPWICGKPFAGPATSASGGNPVVLLPVCVMENTTFGAAAPNNNTQCSWFLLDGTTGSFTGGLTGVPVAKALYGAYGVPSINSVPPTVAAPCSSPAIGSGFATLVSERTALAISNGLNVSPTGLCRLTLTPNASLPPIRAELGPVTYFAGGQLCTYDGGQIVEHGFPLFPEGIGAAIAAGAGMTDGIHQIVAVYEWTDAQGHRHQSSPSMPVSVTANTGAGNNQATVNVPTLLLSQKPGVNVVLYMTQAGGLSFTRLTLRAGHPAANNTGAAFVTITILESDAAIAGNEPLYTQPNQGGTTLPSDAPPPCTALCVSQNRLWLLNADSPLEYRYSQAMLNGFGLQFGGLYGEETLGGLVPSESGGTVAVAALDEKTIVLCARKLYVVYGGAPDPGGNNSTLSEPQEIPSPVGCSDALSVLAMPQGLMFKAQSGWHLLGRDLSVHYIGDGVSSKDGNAVISATLMRDRQECRFETSGVGANVALVFSYLLGQWSVFQRGALVGAADALWYPTIGRYVFINAAAPFGLFEDVPLFSNGVPTGANPDDFVGSAAAQQVTGLAITPWLKLSALEGFQRIRRLYLTGTPANGTGVNTNFTLIVGFDDDAGSSASYRVDVQPLIQTGATIDIRHRLQHQKCKSVQFTFEDTGPGANAAVLGGLQALALEVGVKRGVNKLSAGQTV